MQVTVVIARKVLHHKDRRGERSREKANECGYGFNTAGRSG